MVGCHEVEGWRPGGKAARQPKQRRLRGLAYKHGLVALHMLTAMSTM